ncbi:chloride channel protein [Aquimarina sp. MMG015]|uniref:chloride channel protein n=1 Tax=Aquimarina TaxID=290174 RepID=UPI0003FEA09F|nr:MULTISPECIES: chloride channel protein [Aquimarina]AXT57697.1 chloride channel protein [Aquimarina sp. AD1]MBQ4805491.1 chloride channel protein [Aquimarina sp. MMG015]RKN37049.1 chloride channel protein [Aquimarina sp. AD1]
MPAKKKTLLHRFLIWRYRHISNKNFVLILSVFVGFCAGLISLLLKNITHLIQVVLESDIISWQTSFYFIIPMIGLLIVYIITKFIVKKSVKSAIPMILYSLSKKDGKIKPLSGYLPLLLSPITVGFGGSVGLLGPAVGSGSTLSSNLSSLFKLDTKTRFLLIGCAAAGAISAVFKSPLAGLVFAVEVFSLDLTLTSLLPLLFASVSSIITSYFFLGDEVLFSFDVLEKFDIYDTPFYIILGIGTAVASIYFTKMYFGILHFFDRFPKKIHRLLIGGFAIGIMLYFIPPLYGEGLSFINDLLNGNHLAAIGNTPFDTMTDNIWMIIALLTGITIFKAIAMTATFGAGGSGGIIIPTMVMGSALGNVVSKIINNLGIGIQVSEANFTLLGMAGLIAGVLHAPLTSIFLIAEITSSYELFVPLMITTAISFIISKNSIEHNIYTRELAEQGLLLTHDKDQTVLTLMKLDDCIETNFIPVNPEHTLKHLLSEAVAKSNRNLFPVVDESNTLLGIVKLDNIRDIMFDISLYHKTTVAMLMTQLETMIVYEEDDAKTAMRKFQDTGAWNLPVVKNGRYYGFISKSKLLTAYRRKLINFTR